MCWSCFGSSAFTSSLWLSSLSLLSSSATARSRISPDIISSLWEPTGPCTLLTGFGGAIMKNTMSTTTLFILLGPYKHFSMVSLFVRFLVILRRRKKQPIYLTLSTTHLSVQQKLIFSVSDWDWDCCPRITLVI